jgi:hypothetical protein
MDFPHDGGYTAKQEIFVVMKNTDREGSRQFFGINTVDDQVTILLREIRVIIFVMQFKRKLGLNYVFTFIF